MDRVRPAPVTTPDPTGAVDLDHLLAALDPDQRVAFVLTQVLGLRYAEAAEAIGCPVGTIRSRVARAREALVAAIDTPADLRGRGQR
jgi:RNA polymerase sigma-70 factor (ECF subfamily)